MNEDGTQSNNIHMDIEMWRTNNYVFVNVGEDGNGRWGLYFKQINICQYKQKGTTIMRVCNNTSMCQHNSFGGMMSG